MYNEHLNILGSETYTAGLHTGVPGYIFIKFPSVFKSLEFDSVLCLDNEGVYIKLTIQLQYRARPKHLRTIIQQYKDYDNYVKILRYAYRGEVEIPHDGLKAIPAAHSYFDLFTCGSTLNGTDIIFVVVFGHSRTVFMFCLYVLALSVILTIIP